MRVIFMGTPEFAVLTLVNLTKNSKHDVISVVTSVDKPRGRGRKLLPSPVKSCALELNLPVIQPQNLKNNDFLAEIRAFLPDVFVVVAFRILPAELFLIPKYGAINLHASLLPKYRGAAPVQWALIHGETKTGVTTFQIDEGIDTGKYLLQKEVNIYSEETAGELSHRLAEIGAKLIINTLDDLESGTVHPKPQHSQKYSHAPKITHEMLLVDWSQSARDIINIIRAFSPEPGAQTVYNNVLLKIFRARIFDDSGYCNIPGSVIKANPNDGLLVQTGSGIVEIIDLQREGKKRMLARELLRGMHIAEGDVFH